MLGEGLHKLPKVTRVRFQSKEEGNCAALSRRQSKQLQYKMLLFERVLKGGIPCPKALGLVAMRSLPSSLGLRILARPAEHSPPPSNLSPALNPWSPLWPQKCPLQYCGQQQVMAPQQCQPATALREGATHVTWGAAALLMVV